MSKHTPGPWEIDNERDEAICVWKRGGEGAISGVIATVRTTTWCHNEQQDEQRGNARLIAAAPELLEALKACDLQLLQSNNDSDYAREAHEAALAAIAKAEGRS